MLGLGRVHGVGWVWMGVVLGWYKVWAKDMCGSGVVYCFRSSNFQIRTKFVKLIISGTNSVVIPKFLSRT